jgi:putative heme-binding domain-containing protein
LPRSGSGTRLVARLLERTRAASLDDRASESARVQAIASLCTLDPSGSRSLLLDLLDPRQPLTVQIAAVRALAEDRTNDTAQFLLARLRGFEPSVRAAAVRTLLTRTSWTKIFLQAASRNDPSTGITPRLVEPADRGPLLKHRNTEIARLAHLIFDQPASRSRAQVIAEYLTAFQPRANASRGAKVFDRECKTCHRVGDRGFALGPDLTGSPSGDSAALLANILDPNASVLPDYVQYLVIDQNGRTYSGIITAETATSLTLQRGEGRRDMILRAQIAEMTDTGVSLMPDGFEKTISKPEMADLIAFLRAAHRAGDGENTAESDQTQPLDIGTLPGLIEPDP